MKLVDSIEVNIAYVYAGGFWERKSYLFKPYQHKHTGGGGRGAYWKEGASSKERLLF